MPEDPVLVALKSQNTKAIVGLVAVAFVTGGLWMKLQTDVSAIKEATAVLNPHDKLLSQHEWLVLDHEKRLQRLEARTP